MADTSLPASEYVKQTIFIILIAAVALFGIKSCRKYQKKRDVVIELTSHASESSAYQQFYAADARSTLLKAMHQMYLAAELGITPTEILAEVMEESGDLLDTQDKADLPIRQQLIRDSLLSNYDNCRKLDIFSHPNNITLLEKGELPIVRNGPATDREVFINTIIPTSAIEGIDKLIPNLLISPPPPEDEKPTKIKPNKFEVARAKQLAKSLATASLIEREAYQKIIAYYDNLAQNDTEPITPSPPKE